VHKKSPPKSALFSVSLSLHSLRRVGMVDKANVAARAPGRRAAQGEAVEYVYVSRRLLNTRRQKYCLSLCGQMLECYRTPLARAR
jgi:hypothetical protein